MTKFDPAVLAIEEELIQTRRLFHAHPEASLKEFETAAYLRDKLDAWNISWVAVGETGTLATIEGSQPGPTVLLRGDIDALELVELTGAPYASQIDGLCHACGHDAHASALLFAAKILAEKKDQIHGKVKLAFQQAEEVGAGARQFVAAGHLDDVDLAFGQHVSPLHPAGSIAVTAGPRYGSVDIFQIHVKGLGTHAASPHQGHDAALATAAILLNLQNIAARRRGPLEPIVISIGKIEAGTRYNVVAEDGRLEGTLRTLDSSRRPFFLEEIEKTGTADRRGVRLRGDV